MCNILLKILWSIKTTFGVAVTAIIRWWNLVPPLGVIIQPEIKMLERDIIIFRLKLLKHRKIVQFITKFLAVYINIKKQIASFYFLKYTDQIQI